MKQKYYPKQIAAYFKGIDPYKVFLLSRRLPVLSLRPPLSPMLVAPLAFSYGNEIRDRRPKYLGKFW